MLRADDESTEVPPVLEQAGADRKRATGEVEAFVEEVALLEGSGVGGVVGVVDGLGRATESSAVLRESHGAEHAEKEKENEKMHVLEGRRNPDLIQYKCRPKIFSLNKKINDHLNSVENPKKRTL